MRCILVMTILGMMGCSKQETTSPSPETLSATSDGTIYDYQLSGYKKATVKVGIKFTSSSQKTCLLDSIEVNSPNDSVSGGRAILRKTWYDTLASGDTISREFTIADSRDPFGRDPGAAPYPPGPGRYYLRAWGRWGGSNHESSQYAWTW